MSNKDNKYLFRDQQSKKIILSWWKGLEDNKGDRAKLRRAGKPSEVVFVEIYHKLYYDLISQGYKIDKEKLAAIAGLISNVKENENNGRFAQQMAEKKTGDKAVVSSLRFRRLLQIEDEDIDDLYIKMIRIIRLLDGRVNIGSLAESVYWWKDKTRKEWAYDYYEKAPNEDKSNN